MSYEHLFFLTLVRQIFANEVVNSNTSHTQHISDERKYMGERFPIKYLTPEETLPAMQDLNHYLNSLKRTVNYFANNPNATDVNKAIGIYFMKVALKRTIQDEQLNLAKHHIDDLLDLIRKGDYIISHYSYCHTKYGWLDAEFRVSKLFQSDEAFVYSTREFNKNKLKNWIHSAEYMNEFVEDIDNVSLAKEKYIELMHDMKNYHISILDSDKCISRIAYNHIPTTLWKMQPCKPDPYCKASMLGTPSVAYALSHRMLNVLGLRFFRGCSLVSEEYDDKLLNILCAFMYREAVYVARRGFFARDMFLEHIALCSFLGYEEFHRKNWFYKATSWMDEDGCIKEDTNFIINRTRFLMSAPNITQKKTIKLRKLILKHKIDDCQNHPMALLVTVLAHAIRHAAHFVAKVDSESTSQFKTLV